jgi:aspartyl-tRNA(Asn)/glutamyl-tRNA(Gln) amidotransferase subunit A
MTQAALKMMPTKLTDLTITQAREGLKKKQFSATELAKAHIAAVEKARPLNAFVTETPEVALKAAAESDKRIAAGQMREFEGIPTGLKDLFCTKDVRTTASSRMLEKFVPTYESTVSQKLLDAGACMLGKLSLDEFAMGASNRTSYFGHVKNPWKATGDDKDRSPGGSSGGSAAAVAARCIMAATGSDTAGSARQPAALTGTVGSKPTYGRASRYGMVAFASSLDQAGAMTRTVRDNAIMTKIFCGYDPKDSTSAKVEIPDFEAAMTGNVKGLKIGIPKECREISGIHPEILKLWEKGVEAMKAAGAIVQDISIPHMKYSVPIYYIIAPAEASSNLARYDGVRYGHRAADVKNITELYEKSRGEGFGWEVKRRMLMGAFVLSSGFYDAYYRKAQQIRQMIQNEFNAALKQVDVIMTPTAPGPAFALNEKSSDPVQMFLEDVFTVPANHTGMPAISVPAGLSSNGLPLGLQFIGRMFDEGTMFRAAEVLEREMAFDAKPQFIV